MIIFDCGSGNTCENSIDTACKMVKEIFDIGIPNSDKVIKWQLFKSAGKNIPLSHEVFERACRYADVLGIRTTASVFDEESLEYLLKFGVPFVKIANNDSSREVMKKVPSDIPIIQSIDKVEMPVGSRENLSIIYTVSKYPADKKDYEKFGDKLKKGISDHTENFDLYLKHSPKIYEFHFKLKDSKGLDAGSFARTKQQFEDAFK
jgi:sialic acid synthase SpsE